MQGAWAQNFDVWDGVSEKKPGGSPHGSYGYTFHIRSAAELAWLTNHFYSDVSYWNDWDHSTHYVSPYESDIEIYADIDMTAGEWIPFGKKVSSCKVPYGHDYNVTFNGNDHTIRIKIDNTSSDNYQGLFLCYCEKFQSEKPPRGRHGECHQRGQWLRYHRRI